MKVFVAHGTSSSAGATERYELIAPIAAGGMATIHLGRMLGAGGFERLVAIKRLQGHLARDPELALMLLDEGKLASRISHANVVPILDVVRTDDDLFLVMEYVEGVPLSFLTSAQAAAGEPLPIAIASAITVGVLHGLHAAHEARGAGGEPLGLIHRDVSPQNVLLAADGVPRVVDFGIAKAAGRSREYTRDGEVKGKLPYMAPEQLRAGEIDRRVDVWAASIVLWELLVGRRPFEGEPNDLMAAILHRRPPALKTLRPEVPDDLEAVIRRGLSRFPEDRFATAREMAVELERAMRPAGIAEVGAWVERLAGEEIARRATMTSELSRRAPERVLETGRGVSPLAGAAAVGPRPTRAPRIAIVAVAALGIAILAGVALARRPRAPIDAPSPAEGDPVASAAAVAPPPLASPSPATSEEAAPATSTVEEKSAPSPSLRRPPAKASPARSPGGVSRPPRRDERCYRLDGDGIWHIRPECL